MINFAEFAKKKEQSVKYKIPAVVFTHGTHANRPEIPSLYIQHGKHSDGGLNEEYQSFKTFERGKHPNQHLGAAISEASMHLEDLHSKIDMSDKETQAIRQYTNSSYALNKDLHKHNGDFSKIQFEHGLMTRHLDSAIKKHELPKMTLLSGIKKDPRQLTEATNGVFHSPAFVSSTIHPSIAFFFANGLYSPYNEKEDEAESHILKFHINEGQKGLFVGNRNLGVRKLTNSTEHEVLLPRDNHYKITGKSTYDDAGSLVHVWDTHIIPKGANPHTWKPGQK
jgi:hypothetical protein